MEGVSGINDWGLTYNTDYGKSAYKRKENQGSTFSVKACPTCNNAFELIYNQYKGMPDIHYYEHFYKRGLHRQVCPKCK
tara:strand:+ start:991 stop:1227 length:237 start_codon:yes stop_codon:yes gene_type:complete